MKGPGQGRELHHDSFYNVGQLRRSADDAGVYDNIYIVSVAMLGLCLWIWSVFAVFGPGLFAQHFNPFRKNYAWYRQQSKC